MSTLTNIKQLIALNRFDEAADCLTAMIEKGECDGETLLERGKLYWRLDRRADAIVDYKRAADQYGYKPAITALQMVSEIMDFYNPDLLNP